MCSQDDKEALVVKFREKLAEAVEVPDDVKKVNNSYCLVMCASSHYCTAQPHSLRAFALLILGKLHIYTSSM